MAPRLSTPDDGGDMMIPVGALDMPCSGGLPMSKHQAKRPPRLADLSSEYWRLFFECKVRQEKLADVTRMVTRINTNRQRYERVAGTLGTLPWWFVALVHAMESSLDFTKHLHNGDPLTARTTHVPVGRPTANPQARPGEGPGPQNSYSWEESARDALRMKNLDRWTDWTIRASFYKLEEYNGWGYRLYHPGVLSPYLWSYTNHYSRGKYAADGRWDANLVSNQPGAAALLRVMVDTRMVFPIDYVGDFPLPSSTTRYV
jgi:lysozyme family protein